MLYDLTQVIRPQMPVYPGTESPRLQPACTLERHGYRETMLRLGSHTGTHMDAPAHILPGGVTLDKMDISCFCGTAAVIDCQSRRTISADLLDDIDEPVDFLLFHTGWDQCWDDESYYDGFPVLDEAAAQRCTQLCKKGIGVDAISVDLPDSELLPNHYALLEAGLVIVENLRNLTPLVGRHVRFAALPLLYAGADGAPVRAIGEAPEDA